MAACEDLAMSEVDLSSLAGLRDFLEGGGIVAGPFQSALKLRSSVLDGHKSSLFPVACIVLEQPIKFSCEDAMNLRVAFRDVQLSEQSPDDVLLIELLTQFVHGSRKDNLKARAEYCLQCGLDFRGKGLRARDLKDQVVEKDGFRIFERRDVTNTRSDIIESDPPKGFHIVLIVISHNSITRGDVWRGAGRKGRDRFAVEALEGHEPLIVWVVRATWKVELISEVFLRADIANVV